MKNFTFLNNDVLPSEYTVIGYAGLEMESDGYNAFPVVFVDIDSEHATDDLCQKVEDLVSHKTNCNHCNRVIRYLVITKHDETGRINVFGSTCGTDLKNFKENRVEGIKEQAMAVRKKAKFAKERAERKAKAEAFLAENAGLEEALKFDHHITNDLARNLNKWGSLSEAQINLAFKLPADAKAREEKIAEQRAKGLASKHYGEVKERVKGLHLKTVFVTGFETQFGWMNIAKFNDQKGNIFVYKGSLSWRKGYEFTADFTVKEHTEYKGEKQTTIQRIRDITFEESQAA